jgi:type IV pilus assembly protein PilQ
MRKETLENTMMLSQCRKNVFFTILIAVGLLSGCASQEQNDSTSAVFDQWREKALQSRGYSPASRVRSLELPSKKIETFGPDPATSQKPEKALPHKSITMKMHQADAAVILRALVSAVDLNIMINENIAGKISINVTNAPWDHVFTGILKSQGLDYEWEGDIIRIVTIEDRERSLKNLEAEQKIMEKKWALKMQAPMVTKIIPIDYAQAEPLKTTIETLLSQVRKDEYKGAIMVDSHTNSLVVQATPADIERIIPLIVELDRPIPQIIIEAHIVEATDSTARELGVQWGGLQYNSANNTWITSDALGSIDGITTSDSVNPDGGSIFNFPADISDLGMTLGLVAQGADGLLALQLTALEEEGKLNILSSPSITTIDNRKAIIESGDEVPIQTIDQDGNIKIEYKRAVLSLEVTPHVIQNDALMLDIATSKDEIDFSREVGGNPTITTKKATTNVILFDGQTTVIGGLKKNTHQESRAGVPWLSKVPVLGYLFKNQGRSEAMEELLIFITPHILGTKPVEAIDGR